MSLLQRPALDPDHVLAIARRHASGPVGDRAEAAIRELRSTRLRRARDAGLLPYAAARLDRWIHTDAPEHLDDPDVPEALKLRLVRALHLFNRAIGAYDRFFDILRPHLDATRPVRVLELASGSGEFAMALATRARRHGLPVEVCGSDIVQAQVDHARREASRRGVDVAFARIDATDGEAIARQRPDVVFVAHSVHHFPPGLLARVIAASTDAAPVFVAVDGRRSLAKLALIPGPTWLVPWTPHFHDSFLTARKLYADDELALIAHIAAPDARVEVRHTRPYAVLTVLRR